MKRLTILCLVLIVLAMLAAPATAKPPNCQEDPSHPSCGDSSDKPVLAGTECVESVRLSDTTFVGAFDADFSFTMDAPNDSACIDVSKVATGTWMVGFDVTAGSLRALLVVVRDSVAPGDGCYVSDWIRKPGPSGSIEFNIGATDFVNACGSEFAESVAGITYETVEPDIQSPLVLQIFTSGKNQVVDFTVDYPTP